MSTRSIIARPEGDGFAGRYAHWDGYPTCRGRQLWESYAEVGRDAEALRSHALREGLKGYWSSYQTPRTEIDEQAKPEFIRERCDLCNGTGTRTDMVVHNGCNGCAGEGIRNRTYGEGVRNQGWVPEESDNWITSYGDDCGTEWAYVIGDKALAVFERRWGNNIVGDAGHMTGMFGMGAEAGHGYWGLVGTFAWEDQEPNWEAIEQGLPEIAEIEKGVSPV